MPSVMPYSFLYISAFAFYLASCNAFVLPTATCCRRGPFRCYLGIPDKDQIVDADFERVPASEVKKSMEATDDDDSYLESSQPKTLFDLSLDSDPRWKDVRIPFCRGNEYIDGKLAFMVDIDGVSYGIAMPFDDAVAIVEQTPRKSDGDEEQIANESEIKYIDPDRYDEEDDSQELMEIMAKRVKEDLGENLVLRKTPKVLTISGGLSEITDNWQKDLVDKPLTIEELSKDIEGNVDKNIADFYQFMRQELGQEEFDKTMNEELSDEDRELAKLFNLDMDDIDVNLENILEDLEKDVEEAKSFHPDIDGVALKLIGFEFADRSKSYQLVKLLQPVPLVGKQILEEAESGVRFELLTPDEEKFMLPKIEEACQEDLAKAGLTLNKQA